MRRGLVVLVAAAGVLSGSAEAASGAGAGFGEALGVLSSARQAGTGGVMLEDLWRGGAFFEATTVVLQPGARWVGLGGQAGAGSAFRLGAEGFMFQSASSARASELADGSFGGIDGSVRAQELGGRALGQWTAWSAGPWRLAALGRLSGLVQRLPDATHAGAGLEAGAGVQHLLSGGNEMLAAWGLVGPLGGGAGRMLTGRFVAGVGYLAKLAGVLLAESEGIGVGAEGQVMTEGLLQGGLGAVYWIGDPTRSAATYSVRAGIRWMEAGSIAVQPSGGLGVIWRPTGSWGLRFDYALVPFGVLGVCHYATLGVRLAR